MTLALKSFAVSLALASPVLAEEASTAALANDFVAICVEQLPDLSNAQTRAHMLGYTAVPAQIASQLLGESLNTEDWHVFGKAIVGETLALIRFAEKSLDSESQAVLGSERASLCELSVAGTELDPQAFSHALSKKLELGEPSVDFVNSGQREKAWELYVAYNVSILHFRQINGIERDAYSASLIVPQRTR